MLRVFRPTGKKATHPCACGWHGSGRRDCRCDDGAIARYTARISGPLLDRIDLQLAVRPVAWRELDAGRAGPTSREVRERVLEARRRQERRSDTHWRTNAEIPDEAVDELVGATSEARALLGRAVEGLGLSARAARRVLRVGRTIADLAGEKHTGPNAIAEALGYRDNRRGGVASAR